MVIMSFGGNQSAAAAGRERSSVMASSRADITSYDNGLPSPILSGDRLLPSGVVRLPGEDHLNGLTCWFVTRKERISEVRR